MESNIFFCHVPKCAGTTISRSILKYQFNCDDSKSFHLGNKDSKLLANSINLNMMNLRSAVLAYELHLSRCRYGWGHTYCQPKLLEMFKDKWDFVTLLRDPIERWVSEYVYNRYKVNSDWAKHDLSVDEYIKTKKSESSGVEYVKYFSRYVSSCRDVSDGDIDTAISNIRNFAIYGITENLDEWVRRYNSKYGINLKIDTKNKSPNGEKAMELLSNDKIMGKLKIICEPSIHIYHSIKSI